MESKSGCTRLIESFSGMKEVRGGYSIQYPMIEIIYLTICGVMSGFSEWDEIVDFGQEKLPWLRRYLPYAHGIPSHDTVNRVMGMIDYRAFEECFVNWATMSIELPKGVVINIDGKKLRSSATKIEQQTSHKEGGKSAVHLVEAWCSAVQMCLAQYKTADKSNEITAIPVILDWLAIQGCVVTIDAMGCQRDIASKIVGKEADYILALKENHEGLYLATLEAFGQNPVVVAAESYHEHTERGHGRLEKRVCRVLPVQSIPWWGSPEEWKGLKSIVEICSERTILASNKTESEKRYYISSLQDGAESFSQKIRGHWQIENQLHWSLDVQFGEDASRKRSGNAAQNFGLIRRIALNIVKNHPEKISVRRKMNKCAMSDTYREKLLQAIVGEKKTELKSD
jgi:predicted transposase YbfD/YdcC